MIKVEFYNNGLLISGHANANEYGKDIYCAAVSAISQGAITWFNDSEINYEITNGKLILKVIKLTQHNIMLLELLKKQLIAIESNKTKPYIKFKTVKKEI